MNNNVNNNGSVPYSSLGNIYQNTSRTEKPVVDSLLEGQMEGDKLDLDTATEIWFNILTEGEDMRIDFIGDAIQIDLAKIKFSDSVGIKALCKAIAKMNTINKAEGATLFSLVLMAMPLDTRTVESLNILTEILDCLNFKDVQITLPQSEGLYSAKQIAKHLGITLKSKPQTMFDNNVYRVDPELVRKAAEEWNLHTLKATDLNNVLLNSFDEYYLPKSLPNNLLNEPDCLKPFAQSVQNEPFDDEHKRRRVNNDGAAQENHPNILDTQKRNDIVNKEPQQIKSNNNKNDESADVNSNQQVDRKNNASKKDFTTIKNFVNECAKDKQGILDLNREEVKQEPREWLPIATWLSTVNKARGFAIKVNLSGMEMTTDQFKEFIVDCLTHRNSQR